MSEASATYKNIDIKYRSKKISYGETNSQEKVFKKHRTSSPKVETFGKNKQFPEKKDFDLKTQ